jgi:hypothetical protein
MERKNRRGTIFWIQNDRTNNQASETAAAGQGADVSYIKGKNTHWSFQA